MNEKKKTEQAIQSKCKNEVTAEAQQVKENYIDDDDGDEDSIGFSDLSDSDEVLPQVTSLKLSEDDNLEEKDGAREMDDIQEDATRKEKGVVEGAGIVRRNSG